MKLATTMLLWFVVSIFTGIISVTLSRYGFFFSMSSDWGTGFEEFGIWSTKIFLFSTAILFLPLSFQITANIYAAFAGGTPRPVGYALGQLLSRSGFGEGLKGFLRDGAKFAAIVYISAFAGISFACWDGIVGILWNDGERAFFLNHADSTLFAFMVFFASWLALVFVIRNVVPQMFAPVSDQRPIVA